jgi:UDP-glucuronate 4-epimerase
MTNAVQVPKVSRRAVLVTGCAGFIGHAVLRSLLDRGEHVIGIDNLNSYYDPTLKRARLEQCQAGNFEFFPIDVCDRGSLSKVFAARKPTRVVHLAAQAGVRYSFENPGAYIDCNITGFVNVVECVRAAGYVEQVVYASSSSVYGANVKQPHSVADQVDQPVSLYAATKRANELIAHVYAAQFGIHLTGLRYFTVYGPWGRPDMAPLKFARAIFENRELQVYGDGDMHRDFTYIDDIAAGTLLALDEKSHFGAVPHRVYNLGNNHPEHLQRFIDVIERAVGRRARRVLAPMQTGDVRSTCADIDRTTRELNWRPAIRIDDGLLRMVEWARRYYGY